MKIIDTVWCGHGDGTFSSKVTPFLKSHLPSDNVVLPPHLEKDEKGNIVRFHVLFKEGTKTLKSLVDKTRSMTKPLTELEGKNIRIYRYGNGYKFCFSPSVLEMFPGARKMSDICRVLHIELDEGGISFELLSEL